MDSLILLDSVISGNLQPVTSNAVFSFLKSTYIKTKEVTGITSTNGNLDFGLTGSDTIVICARSFNSNGVNNDTIIIPYKYGDSSPSGSLNGRWGGHCISSAVAGTALVNTQIYCTIAYIEITQNNRNVRSIEESGEEER